MVTIQELASFYVIFFLTIVPELWYPSREIQLMRFCFLTIIGHCLKNDGASTRPCRLKNALSPGLPSTSRPMYLVSPEVYEGARVTVKGKEEQPLRLAGRSTGKSRLEEVVSCDFSLSRIDPICCFYKMKHVTLQGESEN